MEGGGLLHLQNKGNLKVERNEKPSLMESMVKGRRGLADISNTINQLQRQAKPMMDQKMPNPVPSSSDKECIAQLLKENTALLRLLGERNKIIELNDLELQRLRVSVQQLQQQNWQLAKANTQMLEELNSGKDRLKAIQHEFGCTVAVLNATKLELEVKQKLKKEVCHNGFNVKEQTSIKCEEAAVDRPCQDEKKPCVPSRKRVSRSQSLGSATVTHEAATKDDNRRKSSRRSSSNFKLQTCEPKEDLFEIEDVKFPVSSMLTDPMNESPTVQLDSSVSSNSCSTFKLKKEEDNDAGASQVYPTQDLHDSSIGRPSRRATMGVSYKEPPLNTKMRRL